MKPAVHRSTILLSGLNGDLNWDSLADSYIFSSFDIILVHLKLQTCFVVPLCENKTLRF